MNTLRMLEDYIGKHFEILDEKVGKILLMPLSIDLANWHGELGILS